ncbi:MAG: PIG-L family deacetylase [Thermoleophilia bacterium]|nr:PIG-L family deacetylase [Thermoleophilia bacterium]
MRLPAGPLLIVSPHLDDAVFSCSALLGRGEPAEVLVAFAGFPNPPHRGEADSKAGFLDSDEAMTVRHSESRNAFADSPHTLTSMGLLPGQYVNGDRSESDRRWIVRAILDWLRRSQGGTIALPAGAGARDQWWRRGREGRPSQDPDHLFARDAGLSALRGISDVRLWLYEEFPLMAGGRADGAVKRLCTGLGLTAGPFAFTINRRDKAFRAGVFRSRRAELGQDLTPATLPVTERYWALSAR